MKFTAYLATAITLASSSKLVQGEQDDNAIIKEERMNSPINVVAQNYTDAEGVLLQGFLSAPANITEKVPAVVILHDSSGIDDYEKQRATMIANELGYAAFAADIFGVETDVPVNTGGWGGPFAAFINSFSSNATLFTQRIVAAVDHVQSLPSVDESKVALLGYCLGGTGVVHYINVAGGIEGGAAAVVGVHPTLFGAWEKPLGAINIPSLFLTGGKDFLTGPQAMATLENDMKSASTVEWETNRYANIDHAFSNWFSDNYNVRADERSWASMKTFLADKFGESDDNSWESLLHIEQEHSRDFFPTIALSTSDTIGVMFDLFTNDQPFKEEEDTTKHITFISVPDLESEDKVPAVIILPKELGTISAFEQNRALQITKRYGYVSFVAENSALLHKFIKNNKHIDSERVAVEGYGDGGSQDALDIAVQGESLFKVASIFQVPANITTVNDVDLPTSKPQLLVSTGVDNDSMDKVIQLENALIGMNTNYEINRYSDAQANFYDWNTPTYNAYAAGRSFETIESIYLETFGEFEVFSSDLSSNDVETTPPSFPESENGASGAIITSVSSYLVLAIVGYIMVLV